MNPKFDKACLNLERLILSFLKYSPKLLYIALIFILSFESVVFMRCERAYSPIGSLSPRNSFVTDANESGSLIPSETYFA